MIPPVVLMGVLLSGQPELGALYTAARSYDKTAFRWKRPAEPQLARTRALIAAVVKQIRPGAPPEALAAQAKAAGFELTLAKDAGGPIWTLSEPAGVRAGAGLYAFRAGAARRLCIQAPHTFFDQGTGEIALSLFARLEASCLFVNTVHRYSKTDPSPAGVAGADEHPADVAHTEATWFAAANAGLLDAAPLAIVQIHGFGAQPELPAEVRAVVADGQSTRAGDAPAVRLRAALAVRLGGAAAVRLYGLDADVLGATTNVEGKAARRAHAIFLHIEMNAATRRALGADVTPLASAIRETLDAPAAKP